MTVKTVRESLIADTVSVKNGVFTVRLSFYFSGGGTSEKFAARVKAAFPTAVILDHGEKWASFSGGQSVAAGSHWWVKFLVPTA
jgi:hypothetical protein